MTKTPQRNKNRFSEWRFSFGSDEGNVKAITSRNTRKGWCSTAVVPKRDAAAHMLFKIYLKIHFQNVIKPLSKLRYWVPQNIGKLLYSAPSRKWSGNTALLYVVAQCKERQGQRCKRQTTSNIMSTTAACSVFRALWRAENGLLKYSSSTSLPNRLSTLKPRFLRPVKTSLTVTMVKPLKNADCRGAAYGRSPIHLVPRNIGALQGGTSGPCSPPKFPAYPVVLCFERRCSKHNTVARLKSKDHPPKIGGWFQYCFVNIFL